MAEARNYSGALPSRSTYVVEAPRRWNGVLLLASHPVPVGPGDPPWNPADPLIRHLVSSGYAVAGSANTVFWPLERVFADQGPLIDVATRILGSPEHTMAFGLSIGGLISGGTVQRAPNRLSGALSLCGNLAGAVANHNRELDIAFVVKTLLGADSKLRITDISEPTANFSLACRTLNQAQATAEGRARLALAAAVGNLPGWYDPGSPEPDEDDFEARQDNQFAWFRHVGFLVYFWARRQVEMQAGGNPSWNTGVDYRALLSKSINRAQVEALYKVAGLDLDGDLDRLASAARIDADPSAVDYLERHIVFDGDLGGVPVIAMHTAGDGLVTPDQEQAYADVVHYAGNGDLLRQLYVDRGGHCTFSFAEILTALDVLITRVEHRSWSDLHPAALNVAAGRVDASSHVLKSGTPAAPRFVDFQPTAFSRPYDARHVRARGRTVTSNGEDAAKVSSVDGGGR